MLVSLLLFTLTAIIIPSIAEITLSEFQSIAEFPQACTEAYDTPVTSCNPDTDFPSDSPNTNSCSFQCISGLYDLQRNIQSACTGVRVDPTTVMGHFFVGSGPSFVCSLRPTLQSTASSSQEPTITTTITSTQSESSSGSTSSLTSSSEAILTTTTTTHSSSPPPTKTVTSTEESSSTLDTSTTTSTTDSSITPSTTSVSVSTSTKSKDTPSSTDTPSFLTTAANQGSATTFTSQAQQTSSSNPDSFGGGGSPFEVSANGGSRAAKQSLWLLVAMLLVGLEAIVR